MIWVRTGKRATEGMGGNKGEVWLLSSENTPIMRPATVNPPSILAPPFAEHGDPRVRNQKTKRSPSVVCLLHCEALELIRNVRLSKEQKTLPGGCTLHLKRKGQYGKLWL